MRQSEQRIRTTSSKQLHHTCVVAATTSVFHVIRNIRNGTAIKDEKTNEIRQGERRYEDDDAVEQAAAMKEAEETIMIEEEGKGSGTIRSIDDDDNDSG